MTKRYIYKLPGIATIAIMLLAGTSCSKLIEIPSSPSNSLSEQDQFGDSSTAMTALAGVYAYEANASYNIFPFNDAQLAIATGLSSDELLTTSGVATYNQFYGFSLTPVNSVVAGFWSKIYSNLYSVNAIIKNAQNSSGLSNSFKKQVVGEMKVVRALYLFNLVNLFGRVPLITSTDYNVTAYQPRTSVDSIYNQVIADLQDAEQALSAAYPSAGRARPNLYTAATLLAKVYLYRKQWQAAYDEASKVINSNSYSLVSNLNSVFLNGSTEAIWQLPATGNYSATAEGGSFLPSWWSAPSYVMTKSQQNAFESGDRRLTSWAAQTSVSDGNGGYTTAYYPYKYKKSTATSNSTTEDYMIFRLSEVYLIRAEAAARLGKGADALEDLDIVRDRAGLDPSSADPASETAVLASIMRERRTELFSEWGNRWFDLKRTDLAATVLSAEKTGWTNNAALYPIPRVELLNNVALVQNPGY